MIADRHLLVHYHLRPGGVTTVLREQARVLTALGLRVCVASGEAPLAANAPFPVPVEVIPALGYRDRPLPLDELETTRRRLAMLAGPDGVVHFHNPTLGKNPSWMALVNQLARDSHPLLLQVHDFGEDGRWQPGKEPTDHAVFYPRGGRVRWLVLHPDDREVLLRAGHDEASVRVLVNPVSAPGFGDLPSAKDGKTRVLYPARGIRRKNIGEFLLLAALAPSSWEFRTTLPPIGAAQARSFARWQRWTAKLGINALLGGGWGEFRPDLVLSTSVREGFGYTFAEPWLVGIPATGRLPGRWLVGEDALPLPHPAGLYNSIRVPTHWIRARVWQRGLGAARPDVAARATIARRMEGSSIDFADLPESEQRSVLRRIVENRKAAGAEIVFRLPDGRLIPPTIWFAQVVDTSADLAQAMVETIQASFAPGRMGERLHQIAAEARTSTDGLHGYADASMVAKAFAKPECFRFLCLPPP